MTLKETMEADVHDVFLNTDEFADEAIWTPKNGLAQPAIGVLFNTTPLHGDDEQELPVVGQVTAISGSSSDLSGITLGDEIFIRNTNYIVINNPYPSVKNNLWSVIDLRLPHGEETPI